MGNKQEIAENRIPELNTYIKVIFMLIINFSRWFICIYGTLRKYWHHPRTGVFVLRSRDTLFNQRSNLFRLNLNSDATLYTEVFCIQYKPRQG